MGRDEGPGYGAIALRRCLEDIARLTRFDAGNIHGEPVRIETLDVRVDQQIDIVSAARVGTQAGSASGNGPSAGSAVEFDRLVAGEAEAARTNPAVASAVIGHARATAYGGLDKDWSLGDHPRRVYLQRQCDTCGGRGRNRCNTCNGHRQVTCSWCGGRRAIRCNPCGGSGGTRTTITRADGSLEYREDRCIWCHGNGEQPCGSCLSGMVNCSACGARGEVDCGPCGAHGTLTDIATIGLMARPGIRIGAILPDFPRAARAIEQRVGARGLAALASSRDEIWTNPSPSRVIGRTDFSIAACEVRLRGEDREFRALALGADAAIWDYDGVIEHLLDADLVDLEAAVEGFRTLGRGGDDAAYAAVRLFCESEANQDLLRAAGATADDAAVAERLKGTVSSDYVARATMALRRFVARRTRRAALLCLAVGIGIALAASLGLALFPWDIKSAPSQDELVLLTGAVFLAAALVALGAAAWRTGRAFHALGGAPLRAFCRRPGVGFVRRLFAN